MPKSFDLPPSQELVDYYKARIEEFEEERELFISKIDGCDVSHERLHALQWELRKKMNEIEDLQRALSDAQMYAYDERQQLLAVYAENDELKLRELEDRKNIRQLLSLTQPQGQEITYFPNMAPTRMRRLPQEGAVDESSSGEAPLGSSSWSGGRAGGGRPQSGGSSLSKKDRARSAASNASGASGSGLGSSGVASSTSSSSSALSGGGGGGGGGSEPVASGGGGGRVLRTVYMPNEKTESLLLTIKMLQTHCEEQKRASGEHIAALQEDRRRKIEEEKVRAAHDRSMIDDLIKQNEAQNSMLVANTREFLTLRHNAQLTQRLMKEDNEALRAQNLSLASQLADTQERAAAAIRRASSSAHSAEAEIVGELRRQVMEKEELYVRLKEQHEKTKDALSHKVATLKEKCSKLAEAHAKLKRERAHEVEGYKTDIAALKKALTRLEVEFLSEERGDDATAYEMSLLATAAGTSARARSVAGQVSKLKAQIDRMDDTLARLHV